MKSPTSMKFYDSNERPKSQVKIVVTPTSEDLFIKKETDTSNDGFRKSSNVRSPSLQNNIVIPEEAVRSKKWLATFKMKELHIFLYCIKYYKDKHDVMIYGY